eukprot:8476703-Heterocapsa_arctica.AAC.1
MSYLPYNLMLVRGPLLAQSVIAANSQSTTYPLALSSVLTAPCGYCNRPRIALHRVAQKKGQPAGHCSTGRPVHF